MYNYRLCTRDGIDRTKSSIFEALLDCKICEMHSVKWQMGEWIPVTKPLFERRLETDEDGEKVRSKKLTENRLATNASQQYEKAIITHSPSKGEILGVIYRATNIEILKQIPNEYATYTSTAINQLPKARRSTRQLRKPRSQCKKNK